MSDGHANLPAVPDPAAVEGMVFDGEVVEDAAAAVPGAVAARVTLPPRAAAVARHGGYVVAGAVTLWRRRRDRRTLHARMAEAAAATGNHDLALKWAQQGELERHQRHERRKARAETFVLVAKHAHWIAFAWLLAMCAAGGLMAYAEGSVRGFLVPFRLAAQAAAFGLEAATVAWMLVPLVPVAVLGLLWHTGHTAGRAAGWAAVSADGDVDVSIDERAVTQALQQLRIPQITDYLKGGLPLAYIVPCRQEGRGTYCEIRLPLGLPASEITKHARRQRLAAGLYRQVKEVWPGVGADESILRLWTADKGALEDGAGPYPLLADGLTDVFRGVPFGRVLRGDPIDAPLMERNTITGGMPGQGKSSGARVIMAGAALDWRAELWIMIPDVNFDFEHFRRRCSRYVMGAEDEKVETIRDWLSDLKDEVQRRGQLLVDFEVPAVTPRLASAGVGLHPLFVLLEEAHVAIQHHIYGKEISGLLVDIVKLGRKRGIHVIVSTQAPTKDSMPRDVTRNCSNGIAFAVGDHVANDALLGAGAYRAGHRATELIPGTDRGIAVVKGFSGERSEMVQVYFIDVAQVPPVIERSLAEIARHGRGLPGSAAPLPAIEARDLLTDLDAVLGGDRVRLRDVVGLLRQYAPSWTRYRDMTATQLRADLEGEGVKTVNWSGTHYADPAEVRRVLAARDGA